MSMDTRRSEKWDLADNTHSKVCFCIEITDIISRTREGEERVKISPRLRLFLLWKSQQHFGAFEIKCRHNESNIQRHHIIEDYYTNYYTEYLRLGLSRARERKQVLIIRNYVGRWYYTRNPIRALRIHGVIDTPNFDCNCLIIFAGSRKRRQTSSRRGLLE